MMPPPRHQTNMNTQKPSVYFALAFLTLLPPLSLTSTPPLPAAPLPLPTCPATPPTGHLTITPDPYFNITNTTNDNTTHDNTTITPGPTLNLDTTAATTEPTSESSTDPDAKDINNGGNDQQGIPQSRLAALLAVYGIDINLGSGGSSADTDSGGGGAALFAKWINIDGERFRRHHDMLFVYFMGLLVVYLEVVACRDLGAIAAEERGGGGGHGGEEGEGGWGNAGGGEEVEDEGRWHHDIFGVDLWDLLGVNEDEIPELAGWEGGLGAGLLVDHNGRFPADGPVDWMALFLYRWPWIGFMWHTWLVFLSVGDGDVLSASEMVRFALHAGQCSDLFMSEEGPGMPEWFRYLAGYVHLLELPRAFYESVAARDSRPGLMELLVPTLDFCVGVKMLFVDVRNLWVSWRNRRLNGVWGMLMGGL